MNEEETIEQLRNEIDEIDLGLLGLIENRWRATKKIGELKKKNDIECCDPVREKEIIKKISEETSIDKEFVGKIFKQIIEHCREEEMK